MSVHLLIRPKMFQVERPPLGLMYMAGADRDTEIWDVMHQGDPNEYIHRTRPDIVGVTVMTRERHNALQVLRAAKEAGCITVAGGPHVAVMLEQMANYDFVDHLVVRDGEMPWRMLVYDHDQPRVIHGFSENLDDLFQPRWDYANRHPYKHYNVAFGRGCGGNCTFCSTWWVSGTYRHHGEQWITEALRTLWSIGARHLIWEDDCLTNNPENTDILASALSKFKFTCYGNTRADCFSEHDAKELSKVGFNSFSFGIESGSQTILDKINKHSDLEKSLKAREYCKKYHIHFIALMMTGFPFETPETKREDTEFRKKLAPDEWGSLGHIMILPGTALYQQMKREGKITDDFWLGPEEYMRLG